MYPHIYSLLSREPLGHEPSFVFLDASICTMLDLIAQAWSNHYIVYWFGYNLPHIIFHDRGIFLNQCVLPHLLLCDLLIDGRLIIYQLSNQHHVASVPLRLSPLSLSRPRSPYKLSSVCWTSWFLFPIVELRISTSISSWCISLIFRICCSTLCELLVI